jgi:hypothetical protein
MKRLTKWGRILAELCIHAHTVSSGYGGGGGSPNSEAAVECETDHSLPSNAKVKNVWSYTSISLCAFMVWCLIKNGDNFTFRCYLL